jgi:Protein of unknown function (DUF3551)
LLRFDEEALWKRTDGEDANIDRCDNGEPPMRLFGLTIIAAAALAASCSTRAQTYSLDYPVCLHVYGPATHVECAFTSLPQCNATASGRAAQCELNPFIAYAEPIGPLYHQRRHHRHMHRVS